MADTSSSPLKPKAGASLAELEDVEFTQPIEEEPAEKTFFSRLLPFLQGNRRNQAKPRKTGPLPEFRRSDSTESQENILYLAYGSNLCAATFQGNRGIRPISAANVWVPELELTFDLPGVPYNEPCFANTRFRRKDTALAKLGDDVPATERDALIAPPARSEKGVSTATALGWDKGLIGVVYEVTPADYAHILITEGGGSSYSDIEVVCHPLGRGDVAVPDVPPEDGSTFIAHTLLARGDRVNNNRRAGQAQASKRYLGLLQTGAREHRLPQAYRDWLAGLQPYTVTSWRQAAGKWLLALTWFPWIMALFLLQRWTADEKGRSRPWVAALLQRFFGGTWWSYDHFFKPVFGEGERTVER